MKKASLHNLGCKVNAYETEAMQQMLEEAGYEIVPFPQKADVYVINTCSVTNIADRKSRQMLHRARKSNPDAIVVAVGCYAQTREEEAAEDSAVDIIIGNNQKHKLLEQIAVFQQNCGKTRLVCDINHEKQEYEELFLSQTSEHTRAFMKVQDGCNQFCSYCIIPYARGRVRSRKLSDVLAEAARLAAQGYKEIVLTGIHLSSYGTDCGESLLHLIQDVCHVPGIERVRLGSLEPGIVQEDFVREIAALPKLCPHFHLSLQSGCDETLKRMNRKYTTAEYEKSCQLLRKYFIHPAITTDVITGFPGESEEEFAKTREFLERIHFYELHVFPYSKRRGTKAAEMVGQVLEQIKAERSRELIALGKKMSKEFRDDYRNTRQTALLEEIMTFQGQKYFVGYIREYVKVAIKSNEDLTNKIVEGLITAPLTEEIYVMEVITIQKSKVVF